MTTRILTLLLLVLLSGCSAARSAVAMMRSTDQFLPYAGDSRVRYEPGAQAQAQLVAENLNAALATVETAQYRRFREPVVVYVCASVGSFGRYCANPGAGGCVLNHRLFISPKPENTPERLPGVLTHELSHLHLSQSLGTPRAAANLPPWFMEGLATWVAGGAGAENVSEEQARLAIRDGRRFEPIGHGGVLFRQTPSSVGLTPHMYYRQGSLFVAWLHARDPAAFRRLLLALQDDQDFEAAFAAAYESSLRTAWEDFVDAVKAHAVSRRLGVLTAGVLKCPV